MREAAVGEQPRGEITLPASPGKRKHIGNESGLHPSNLLYINGLMVSRQKLARPVTKARRRAQLMVSRRSHIHHGKLHAQVLSGSQFDCPRMR